MGWHTFLLATCVLVTGIDAKGQDPSKAQREAYFSRYPNIVRAGRVFGVGNARGFIFLLEKDPATGSDQMRMQVVDRNYSSEANVVLQHCWPFFESRIETTVKAGELKAVASASDSAFYRDLALASTSISSLPTLSHRIWVFETPGIADSFLIAVEPDLRADPSSRTQVSSPKLGEAVESVVVIDRNCTEIESDLPAFLSEIKSNSDAGWSLLSVGQYGLSFKNATGYRIASFNGTSFVHRDFGYAKVRIDVPSWAEPEPSPPYLVPASERPDLLVGLTVCSRRTWNGRFRYLASPALWAIDP